jgi:hypothetical protein
LHLHQISLGIFSVFISLEFRSYIEIKVSFIPEHMQKIFKNSAPETWKRGGSSPYRITRGNQQMKIMTISRGTFHPHFLNTILCLFSFELLRHG